MQTDCNNSGMFTPAVSKTLWLTQKHTGHKINASFYFTAFV